MKKIFLSIIFIASGLSVANAQSYNVVDNNADADPTLECTSITVGKKASADGSVMTSHTDDSGRTRTNILIVPAADHAKGATKTIFRRVTPEKDEYGKMKKYDFVRTGEIPQVAHTYKYFSTAYPCLNEHQLAIGESTFTGRKELQSDAGLIDCTALCELMMERCSTARQAIALAGDLLKRYGWNDFGEALTIADKNEVWHLEIVGPGKGKVGAVWVAQRVPDDHIAVNANASTIREIDLRNKDYFAASDNIFSVAQEMGFWNKKSGEPFRFAYAYAPDTRMSLACRRREWRVFDLMAPSLGLDPNQENYPFSVKPDAKVTKEKMMEVFKDYYQGTEYDMRKNLTVTDKDGKTVISPVANPFMKADEQKLMKINGGWHWRGERTIAVYFTIYATIIQCRSDMPDPIGGLLWFALDNVASSIYVPLYMGITSLPKEYETDGRQTGFSRNAAWWVFNRVGTIAAKRWGDMSPVVEKEFAPLQKEFIDGAAETDRLALEAYRAKDYGKVTEILDSYSNSCANTALQRAWSLGDMLWTMFDNMW